LAAEVLINLLEKGCRRPNVWFFALQIRQGCR
jgi:hypothetical protein